MVTALRHGVLGVGFMGKVHIEALNRLANDGAAARLLAVADPKPERREGKIAAVGNLKVGEGDDQLFDPDDVRAYSSPYDLLADSEVDSVSICTRTDSHVDLSIAALEAGKHVLVEKPIALCSSEVERLRDAARASDCICMPAMCMRFWPGWDWLLEVTRDQRFGSVRSAVFHRLASPPAWSQDFYGDESKSGGALFDVHVHDADFVVAAFGIPDAVRAAGNAGHITALYDYASGPSHVVAEGGWDHTPGFPFRMRYTVVFDQATADFELGRDPALLLCRDGEATPVELVSEAGYDGEMRHFIAAARGEIPLAVTLDDALSVTRLLEDERRSLR